MKQEKRCKIVEELINLTDKPEEKNEIKVRFEQNSTLFQLIIYTYSTNAIYRNFNKVLASDEYHKILETLTYLFSCILSKMSQNKEKSAGPGTFLYRGTKRSRGDEYMNNNRMFWKAFTSTSINLERAEKFTEKNVSGTIFEIRLLIKIRIRF